MIASVLLVGIFIGGLITWALTSGRRYMPEEVVEYLMKQERQQKSVPVVPDSVQLADTLTSKVDSSRMQVQPSDTVNKEKVVPGTPKKRKQQKRQLPYRRNGKLWPIRWNTRLQVLRLLIRFVREKVWCGWP